jgi:putative MATE family efflux protein
MTSIPATIFRLFPDRQRRKMVWGIALPIMGGMMSQNVLNLVDIGMVGRLGDSALAATGIGSFTNYLAISFIIGLSAGVQALAARRLGEGKKSETAVPLNGGLMLALIMGIPLCIVLILATPYAFTFLTADPEVRELGIPYLQVRIASMMAVGMNFSFRGYWSAIHMTGVYLRTLLIMHAINIFLNWVLIFGNLGAPELGVFGAGLATTISLYIGTALYFYFAVRHASDKGFLRAIPPRGVLWQQFRLSLPSSLQQLFFSAGLVTLVWIVGRIGTAEVAAINILMTFHITAMLPAFGIALAATTLVGNALGREDVDDAAAWGWNCAALTFVYGATMSLILIPLADPILNPPAGLPADGVVGHYDQFRYRRNGVDECADWRRRYPPQHVDQRHLAVVLFPASGVFDRASAGIRPARSLDSQRFLPGRTVHQLRDAVGGA